MKISSAEYLCSIRHVKDRPEKALPEVAFLGRSNVGKSSLINMLLNRRGLAKTSGTPGKTQCINYFLINQQFHLVDLPGYGYARVSRKEKEKWQDIMAGYLGVFDRQRLLILLVDSRHTPMDSDCMIKDWLERCGAPFQVVATKADKLSGNQLQRQLRVIRETLAVSEVLPVSALSDKGRLQLWSIIGQNLGFRPTQVSRDVDVAPSSAL